MKVESAQAPPRSPAGETRREGPLRTAEAFGSILARLMVKAMRATLRNDGPLSGGSGARLFGTAMEEVLSEAVAFQLRHRNTAAPQPRDLS